MTFFHLQKKKLLAFAELCQTLKISEGIFKPAREHVTVFSVFTMSVIFRPEKPKIVLDLRKTKSSENLLVAVESVDNQSLVGTPGRASNNAPAADGSEAAEVSLKTADDRPRLVFEFDATFFNNIVTVVCRHL